MSLDRERASQLADAYTKATGIQCILIDGQGTELHCAGAADTACKFCSAAQRLLNRRIPCNRTHLYGAYQAERFGGKYIFFCPISLTHWAAPIMDETGIAGALLGGPVIMIEHEEFFEEEIRSRASLTEADAASLRSFLQDVPYVAPERVTGLAEILASVAAQLSGAAAERLKRDEEGMQLHSRIAEYVHYIKSLEGNDVEGPASSNYPIEKERELLSLIRMGDRENARRVLNEILGHVFFSSGRQFAVIRARVLELVVLLSRAALEGGADSEEIFGLNFTYLNQIEKLRNEDDLAVWLARILVRFSDCVFALREAKHVDVLYKSIDFMKHHYRRKISLDEVANAVSLSPSYFSRVFKEEAGVSFSSYLNRVRIERAKALLLSKDIPLSDIAGLVGFEDQSYFTRVFSKVVGTSPGRFRERRGQGPTAKSAEKLQRNAR